MQAVLLDPVSSVPRWASLGTHTRWNAGKGVLVVTWVWEAPPARANPSSSRRRSAGSRLWMWLSHLPVSVLLAQGIFNLVPH